MADADPPWASGPSRWQAPPVRADALVLTWAMLLLGHVLVAVLSGYALAGGTRDRTSVTLAAFWVVLILGVVGGAVAAHGLRVTLAVRRAEQAERVPSPPGPAPIVPATGVALLAVGLAVIAVVLWQAAVVLPAVAGELVFVPLALRTQHYADDARDAAPPWR